MNRHNGQANGFSVDNLFSLDSKATPKRPRPSSSSAVGGSASRAAHLSSSPSHGQTTPYRPTPGPSKLHGSSPAGFPSPAPPATPSAPVIPFSTRSNKLTVQETLNAHLALPTSAQLAGSNVRVALRAQNDPRDYDYRIAFEKAMERSEVLDTLIDEAAQIFKEYYSIEEFGDPSIQSQDDILVVGRLCPETDAAKMTETSTWLESSRMLGSGSRILLKFEPDIKLRGAPAGSGGMGMFPGCLVALKGTNGGGKLFAVKEVLMMPPIDATYTTPTELLANQYGDKAKQLNGAPMSVLVAAGPYTTEHDLEYEPLGALLALVQEERPDVLILTGPFIDADHPLIKRGEVDEFPSQLFRTRISAKLAHLVASSPRTSVLLVPHGRDLTSTHVAFPQAPLVKEAEFGLPKGVRMLPNPTMFSINEVVFGVTSVDVLWSLKSQEFFRRCADAEPAEPGTEPDPLAKDVMARTCRHLLRQRSFYPVFPSPPPSKMLDALNLDVTHYDLVKMGSSGPDIVIAPSIQKHFTRIVDSTIILNPSFLSKSSAPASAGTFARLTIHPMDQDNLHELATSGMVDVGGEPDEPVEHRVWERCRVDIIKV
ncbi:DNA polymerase alpha/epsilon subunit B-domain-containing protein [Rhodotorula diobovata]|uniref:DNA polymerase alpha subunit B n=1 Tax=Rhodotorula diobovata TaxID=5288 RepID=A0A5C5FV86_9BASI|nr:DNA polymerase alpha/epsilon subunit B-domain-containing protein [Rhodotorula diobovata]